MSSGHLASLEDQDRFIQSLANLIGRDSLTTIGGNNLLFRVPATDSDPNPSTISVQNLLIEHNLLMLPSVADIPAVLDNSLRRIRPTT